MLKKLGWKPAIQPVGISFFKSLLEVAYCYKIKSCKKDKQETHQTTKNKVQFFLPQAVNGVACEDGAPDGGHPVRLWSHWRRSHGVKESRLWSWMAEFFLTWLFGPSNEWGCHVETGGSRHWILVDRNLKASKVGIVDLEEDSTFCWFQPLLVGSCTQVHELHLSPMGYCVSQNLWNSRGQYGPPTL